MFSLSDYTFSLPKNLIAEVAASPAHNAKLMIINKKTGEITAENIFKNIGEYLDINSVLFFNNSRVVRARIPLHNADFITIEWHKWVLNGEIFFLEKHSDTVFEALVRPWKKFKIGTKICYKNFEIFVRENTENGRILEIKNITIDEAMQNFGELPLPPYIEYSPEKEADYQNFFAEKNGSVAAPTASLHFTEELLHSLPHEKYFVTLHIGLGTFKTLNTEDIRTYQIHHEIAEVEKEIFTKIFELKNAGKIITAVGTTACRTLESLPSLWKNLDEKTKNFFEKNVRDFWEKISKNAEKKWTSHISLSEKNIRFATEAYIFPGYNFLVIDELITNFHLPESSLLVLVSALIGQEKVLANYHYAIEKEYRFFSFGDGMYIKNYLNFSKNSV